MCQPHSTRARTLALMGVGEGHRAVWEGEMVKSRSGKNWSREGGCDQMTSHKLLKELKVVLN